MATKSLLINGVIYLFGDVGGSAEFGDGFTDHDVLAALAEHGPGDVTVRLNSPGGYAHMGMAIYSLFKSHPGKVTMVVDGVAASAASLIFMAGAVREMRLGAMLMIHDPGTITFGNAADHKDVADYLDKISDNYAEVYALASGKPVDKVREIMKATTWFTADDAVAGGFATGNVEDKAIAFAAFDYAKYGNAPAPVMVFAKKRETFSPLAARARMNLRQRLA